MVVRINPGAFFPLETYSHLNVDAIRQLVEDVNVEAMQNQLAQAIADNELMRQPFANLIVHLLANNHDQEAMDVTKRLHTAFAKQPQTTTTGWPNVMWSQLLSSVAPFAVALEKWEYFDFLIWTQKSDNFMLCGLLVTAAQVSIAKEWLEKGKQFLLEARKLAEVDPILATEAIDHLIGFVDAKLRGEDVSTAGLFMPAAPEDEEDLRAANDFDWDAAIENEHNPDWDPYDEQLSEQEKILRRWQLRLGGKVENRLWSDGADLAIYFNASAQMERG